MLLNLLMVTPLIGVFIILLSDSWLWKIDVKNIKTIGLVFSLINLFIAFIIFNMFDFSVNQFQFIEYERSMNFYIGIDGISIYFILLTVFIIPIAILSNWNSIKDNVKSYIIIILILETLLLTVFLVLDILILYIFF